MTEQIKKCYGLIQGIGSVIDLGGKLNRPSPIRNDSEAISRDWQAVGNDLRDVIIGYNIKSNAK